jgi:hypothetical protein
MSVGRCQDGFDLASDKELNFPLRADLARNGQNPLYLFAVGWLLKGQIAKKCPDGGEPEVMGRRADATFQIEIVKKRDHEVSIERIEAQVRRGKAGPAMSKLQEEFEGISIGGDRMRAGVSLTYEAVGEEAFNQAGKEVGHAFASQLASSRSFA